MALTKPRYLTAGRSSRNGLAGFLQAQRFAYGTATIASGQTSITVNDADVKAGDLIIASAYTAGANAAYVTGVSISAGVSFTITCNTDPGAGGLVIAYHILRAPA